MSVLRPPICNVHVKDEHCEKLSGKQEAFFFISLYLLAFGSAGLRASLPSHGADQFDERDPNEAMQSSTFFNALLLAVCIGGAVSLTFNIYIQYHYGWDWGVGISTLAIILSAIIFAFGLPLYRIHVAHTKNGIIEIIQVYVAAIRNRNLPLPEDPIKLYEIEKAKEAAEEMEFQPQERYFQRIGVGLILSSISMAIAAIIEVKRKVVARDNNTLDALPVKQPLPISIFWLSFKYFIFGIADMFRHVGLLEFFYSEAPKGLKSTSTSFLWCSIALGYFLSSISVKTVNIATESISTSGGWLAGNNINRNHLNLFVFFLSILRLVNFFVYLFVSKRYNYRPQHPAVTSGNLTK